MTRRARWVVRLYPKAWRERYGEEFAALLEDVGPGWRECWDVARGGLRMRLKWNFATVTAACALLGAAVAGGWAYRAPNEYVSTAVMRVERPEGMSEARFAVGLQTAQTEVFSRTSLKAIIDGEDLYREDRKRLPLEDVLQGMRDHDIRVTPLRRAEDRSVEAFSISFSYPDREKAQRATQRIVDEFLARLPAAGAFARVEVLDPPTLPQRPSSPNRWAFTGMGLAVGVGAGLLLLGVRRWPLVAVSGGAAAAAAFAASFFIPNQFVSTAFLRIDPGSPAALRDVLNDERLLAILQKPSLDLYRNERAKMPIAQVLERMRQDISITPASNGRSLGVAISYRCPNRYKAQAVVRELITTVFETNFVEARRRAPHFQTLEVVDPAVLPRQPIRPNRMEYAALGLGAGLMLGIAATLFRRKPRTLTAGAA